jgi:hypothetical protein
LQGMWRTYLHGFALRMANGEVDWRKCPFLLTKELEGERAKLLEVFPDSD